MDEKCIRAIDEQ